MTATPGPVSKAIAPSSTPPRGTKVRLAMPPRLSSTRCLLLLEKSSRSAIGTSGAPCPPAATSRARKSLTTRTPNRSASTAGSPSCQLTSGGSCQIVCPGKAMPSTWSARTPPACSTSWTASAAHSAICTWSRASSAGALGPETAARRAARSPASYGQDTKARSSACVGPVRRTSAASIPSSEVPDISPTISAARSIRRGPPAAGRRGCRGAGRRPRRSAAPPPRGPPWRAP